MGLRLRTLRWRDNPGLSEWIQTNDINHYVINHYEREEPFPAVIRKKKRYAEQSREREKPPCWRKGVTNQAGKGTEIPCRAF